jgi:hypothetical protein
MRTLIFDCEIIHCIPSAEGKRESHLSYCQGWQDYEGMGIAVIGTWRNYGIKYFCGHDEAFVAPAHLELGKKLKPLSEFQAIVDQAQVIVGFNSVAFDDQLCQAHGIRIKTDFDLLTQVRVASGQPRDYVSGLTRKGYSLQNLAIANLKQQKTGRGELAPVLWQEGRKQEVIDYCLNDVRLLKQLYFKFLRGQLYDPTNGRKLPYQAGS